MPRSNPLWSLFLLVALIGAGAVRGQQSPPPRRLAAVAAAWVMPARDDESVVFAELVARARRRFRVQHWGRHAQIVDGVARALALDALPRRALPAVAVGVAVDVAPPAAPQRRAGTSPRAVSVNAAWRRSWAARARRASSRTPHGFGREPAHRVVTFGIDGPRLLPLTLFD